MRLGKLTNSELQENVLSILNRRRPEVLEGPCLGQDCASFKIDDTILISGDPITGADKHIGKLAITINANDIIAAGGECVLCTLTILAPSCESVATIREIVEGAEEEAVRYGLEIVGGHTEFTDTVNTVVVSVTMIGRAKKHFSIKNIKSGDYIVLTKSVAIEGTAILGTENETVLSILSEEEKKEAELLYNELGIGIEGKISINTDGVHAMHDVTEGGLFGAVLEMAEACSLGAEIYTDRVPILDITNKICSALNIDVFRLISSGSLLVATDSPDRLISALQENGVVATVIGRFTDDGKVYAKEGDSKRIITSEADRLFYNHRRGDKQ